MSYKHEYILMYTDIVYRYIMHKHKNVIISYKYQSI